MKKRIFLIVLDSVGIGAASDAAEFGDIGADTMRRIHSSEKFSVPTLLSLGLGNIDGIDYLPKTDTPRAALARLREESRGKDTTIGHWEMAGVISTSPLPTYPNGFPRDVIAAFSAATGRGVLCNKPYSGTDVIRDYGETHMETGDLIVYTSADSVFQIAAHEAIVPPETLYEYCRIARGILTGKNAVGRVIARPFIGTAGNFKRTGNRRDFSLEPTGRCGTRRHLGRENLGYFRRSGDHRHGRRSRERRRHGGDRRTSPAGFSRSCFYQSGGL